MGRMSGAEQGIVVHIGLVPQGGGSWLGGAHYVANLCGALAALPSEQRTGLRLSVLSHQPSAIATIFSDHSWMSVVDLTEASTESGFWRRQKYRLQRFGRRARTPWFDDTVRALKVDFLYPYTPPTPDRRSFACAAWQPDFQHSAMPEMFSASECQERDEAVRAGLSRADTLVLSSEAARADCARYFGAEAERVHVLPFASVLPERLEAEDAPTRYHLPRRYFICCNQFWAHKNHAVVLQALTLLRKNFADACVVFTGHTHDYRRPNHFDDWIAQVHRFGLWGHVRVLGVVPRQDQWSLMRQSDGVIQPSRFEGWSTVVEDARAIGCAMALSDIDVHREQAPERASYFGVDDPARLAEWMSKRLREPTDEPLPWADAQASQERRLQVVGRNFLNIARRTVEARGGAI